METCGNLAKEICKNNYELKLHIIMKIVVSS